MIMNRTLRMKFRNFFLFVSIIFLNTMLLQCYEYNCSIIAVFQNEAPYMKEWIEYHHMIGVDHFWLYDDTSTDNWREVLHPYIEQGLVEVTDWSEPRRKGSPWPEPQKQCYREGLKKAQGVSKWVALIDIDEFILPMADKSLTDCLEKRFSKASGIYITWRNFGTGRVSLNPHEPILFKLTSASAKFHCRNNVGKSIVRPEDVEIDALWFVHHCPPKTGKIYMDGDGNLIPFVKNDMSNAVHHDTYLRLNHYFTRDENWFKEVKLGRKLRRGWDGQEILALNKEFSFMKDFAIKRFIKKNYAQKSKEIWGE